MLVGAVLCITLYSKEACSTYRRSLLEFYESLTNEDFSKANTNLPQLDVGHMRQLLRSLDRLKYFAVMFVAFMLTVIVSLYLGLKFSGNESYKVYTEQYANVVSGLYLRSTSPAVALCFVYVCCFALLAYFIFRLFVEEWSIMRNYDARKM